MKIAIFALVVIAVLICACDAQQYRSTVLLGRIRPLMREYETHWGRYRQSDRRRAERLNRELITLRELERELTRAARNLDYRSYQAYERRYTRHQQRLRELLA